MASSYLNCDCFRGYPIGISNLEAEFVLIYLNSLFESISRFLKLHSHLPKKLLY